MNNVCDMMKALRPFFGGSLSAFYLYGSAAGEWALREGLCPVEDDLRRALTVRGEPMKYKDDPDTRAWLSGLAPAVQRYADTLEKEWVRT